MAQDVKAELLALVKSNINLKGLVEGLIKGVADEALRNAVAASSTKLDDMLVAAIAPLLENQILSIINQKLDQILG